MGLLSKYFIEVSVRDAQKAIGILEDQFRGQFDFLGSNCYTFGNYDTANDAILAFEEQDLEILDHDVHVFDELDLPDEEQRYWDNMATASERFSGDEGW